MRCSDAMHSIVIDKLFFLDIPAEKKAINIRNYRKGRKGKEKVTDNESKMSSATAMVLNWPADEKLLISHLQHFLSITYRTLDKCFSPSAASYMLMLRN